MFAGVDEAGKGAVLGPLVVAAVGCDSDTDLATIPVRDSKTLTPAARTDLFGRITTRMIYNVLVIPPEEIDSKRRLMTMNQSMAMAHAAVISELQPGIAYVDACDVIAPRYGRAVYPPQFPLPDSRRAPCRCDYAGCLCRRDRGEGGP